MSRSQTRQAKRALRAAHLYGLGDCVPGRNGCDDSGCYSWCETCQGQTEPCFAPANRTGTACVVCVVLAAVALVWAAGWLVAAALERWA
jgi:hypothetical protein